MNLNDPTISYSIADRSFIANVQDARRIYSENRSGIYGASSFYMDDILATAIPEPGTLALLLLTGALGIMIRRRR